MHLVTSCNCVLWSRQVLRSFHNGVNYTFQLKLDLVKDTGVRVLLDLLKVNFGSIDNELKRDEVILERSISIVFSQDNLIWLWV